MTFPIRWCFKHNLQEMVNFAAGHCFDSAIRDEPCDIRDSVVVDASEPLYRKMFDCVICLPEPCDDHNLGWERVVSP